MKINYNIIWFEDIQDWYESMVPFVEEYLSEKGFNLISDRKEDGKEIEQLFESNDFDLVLIDYKLKDTELGDRIIEKIRSFSVFTNIVFYSNDGEKKLRELLQKRSIEGVYCASRDGEQFREKVFAVIDLAIKKVQDLNNMRGLVIASTSDLDLAMYDIINKMTDQLEGDEKAKFKEKLKKRCIDSINERAESISKIDLEKSYDKFLQKLESYHRWIAIKDICKDSENLNEYQKNVEEFDKEIIKVRNKLAHIREEVGKDGKKTLKSTLDGSPDFIFDDALCIDIRSKIIKYSDTFNKIKELI